MDRNGRREQPSLDGDQGIVPLVKRMADGFEHLVSDHLTLARLELAEDARILGKRIIRVGVFVPVAIVGFALICAAMAVFLAPYIGLGFALLAVGTLWLAVSGIGIKWVISSLKKHDLMNDSERELRLSAKAISSSASGSAAATGTTNASHSRLEGTNGHA